jgi:hypothetical protein
MHALRADDDFSKITSRAAIKIASFYDVSVSDVIAVCSSVAVELLSAGRVKIIGGTGPDYKSVLRVGRIDNLKPSPPDQLPPADATTTQFTAFWKKHGFSTEEAVALMGTHSLIDDQVCTRGRWVLERSWAILEHPNNYNSSLP